MLMKDLRESRRPQIETRVQAATAPQKCSRERTSREDERVAVMTSSDYTMTPSKHNEELGTNNEDVNAGAALKTGKQRGAPRQNWPGAEHDRQGD
jgi:hypothetical protein